MSCKKSYKELRESIRNEVCRSYTRQIEYLQKRLDIRREELKLAEKERDAAREKLHEAENKLEQYEDWVERLCDYCNLSNEERQLLLEGIDKKKSEGFEQFICNSQLFNFLNFIQ